MFHSGDIAAFASLHKPWILSIPDDLVKPGWAIIKKWFLFSSITRHPNGVIRPKHFIWVHFRSSARSVVSDRDKVNHRARTLAKTTRIVFGFVLVDPHQPIKIQFMSYLWTVTFSQTWSMFTEYIGRMILENRNHFLIYILWISSRSGTPKWTKTHPIQRLQQNLLRQKISAFDATHQLIFRYAWPVFGGTNNSFAI